MASYLISVLVIFYLPPHLLQIQYLSCVLLHKVPRGLIHRLPQLDSIFGRILAELGRKEAPTGNKEVGEKSRYFFPFPLFLGTPSLARCHSPAAIPAEQLLLTTAALTGL